jgi:cellulose synthase/poly-beta-1,6-N-acetylglucosamine synthase-like glycosyltransferase
MTALSLTLTILFVLLLLPPLVWWGLWLLFALLAALPSHPRSRDSKAGATGAIIDVLIPAHNEEILLPRLLETLRLQTAQHRLGNVLVIADHCSDRTASLARDFHAHVLERSTGPRGKPAALRDGIAWLAAHATVADTNRALLILDADCTVSPNLVEQCARALDAGAHVTQAAYILDPTHGRTRTAGQRLHSAATIAFALKNFIRPKGMARLGIPTQLFGTGMCFRCDLLQHIHFEDHLTEDLAMSYDLLLSGVTPRFLPGALVRSPLPEDRAAMSTQKLRWESGQVHTWTKLPALLLGKKGLLMRGRLCSVVAVLDWSAPPLAMAVLYWAGVTFAVILAVVLHGVSLWMAVLPVAAIAMLVGYVLIGGMQVSGIAAVGRLFLALPRFFLWKFSLYAQMLTGRGPRSWQRTPRTPPAAGPSSAVLEEATHAK